VSNDEVRERGFGEKIKMIREEGKIWRRVDIGVARRCSIRVLGD